MKTSTRTLRRRIAQIPGFQPLLSPRDIARRETIMGAALVTMVDYGRETFTLAQLANALEISPGTIRRHFIDMDGLMIEILERHLREVSAAIDSVPPDAPDQEAARRAAYLAATRTQQGGLTAAHHLLTRDRFSLPEEDLEALDVIRLGLGAKLGGISPEMVLSLLDSPKLGAEDIELIMARRDAQTAEALRALAQPRVPLESATARDDATSIRPNPAIPPPDKPPRGGLGGDEPWPESVYERHMRGLLVRAGP
jgi:AcrR family transcriptional regulator